MPTNMQAQITAGCGAGVGAGAVTPGNVINDWADSDSLLASASQQKQPEPTYRQYGDVASLTLRSCNRNQHKVAASRKYVFSIMYFTTKVLDVDVDMVTRLIVGTNTTTRRDMRF